MGTERTCNDCMEKRKNECIGSRNNKICNLFRPAPNISQDIKDNWPKLGDVSYITYKRSGRRQNTRLNVSTPKPVLHDNNIKTTSSHNIIPSSQHTISQTHKQIKRVSFTCTIHSFDTTIPIEFTIVINKEKELAVRFKHAFTKIIDEVTVETNDLEVMINKLELIELPTQKIFGQKGMNVDSWELNIDETIYKGYMKFPNFVEKYKKIINYDSLYKKYYSAFNQYIQFVKTYKL